MAKQSEAAQTKKRKRPKSKGNETKRQRPSLKDKKESNKELLRVLTGEDNDIEHVPKAEADVGSKNHDSDEAQQTTATGIDDAPVQEHRDDKSGMGHAAAAEPRRQLPWPNALSDAHAKKINVTVLLENANLETVKQSGRSGGFVLLNCDDHRHILKKTNRDANDARPDITHQCLLSLMDSPLNKAGRLKVYIRTSKHALIEVHPQTRIPRTIKRFSGLMVELLEKFKVRGTSGSTPLLKVIRNPITSHLPVGTRKIVCTYNTENIMDMRHHAASIAELVLRKEGGKKVSLTEDDIQHHGETVNVLYVVGAMAHGKIMEDWADDYICVSDYPLSAATVCSRITYAYESLFGIM